MTRAAWACLFVAAGCPGCYEPPAAKVAAKTAAVEAEPVVERPYVAPPPGSLPAATASATLPGAVLAPAAGARLEPARPGVTEKGNYEPGLITSPLNVYFTVRERVVYEVQIPKALQIYEFLKNRKPETHDEFMREIVTKNGIKLPELPPSCRYWYDAARGELMVEHPQAKP